MASSPGVAGELRAPLHSPGFSLDSRATFACPRGRAAGVGALRLSVLPRRHASHSTSLCSSALHSAGSRLPLTTPPSLAQRRPRCATGTKRGGPAPKIKAKHEVVSVPLGHGRAGWGRGEHMVQGKRDSQPQGRDARASHPGPANRLVLS